MTQGSELHKGGVLEGIRVVDFSRLVAGPWGTMLLADFGADVIKVETPEGDLSRNWGGGRFGPNNDLSSPFLACNRNKRSIALDLRQEDSNEIVRRLLRDADVVVHSFRPESAEAIGIGREDVKSINPATMYCAISGFGQDGPMRNFPGQDQLLQAYTGISSITGEEDRPAVRIGPSTIDILAGTQMALGVLLGLYNKSAHNATAGQQVDIALYDAAVAFMSQPIADYTGTGNIPGKFGPYFPHNTPCGNFTAGDKRDFHIAVVGETKWPLFCKMIDAADLATDPRFVTLPDRVRNQDQLYAILGQTFLSRPAAEWVTMAQEIGLTASEIHNVAEVVQQPQALFRKAIIDVPDLPGVKTAGIPVRMDHTPGTVRTRPPLIGEHSEAILAELGYSGEQIRRFLRTRTTFTGRHSWGAG